MNHTRIEYLNNKPLKKEGFVFYWIQQSQRTEYNYALEYSIDRANELNKTLIAIFILTDDFPEANERHYCFMIEGLIELNQSLMKRGIKLYIIYGYPPDEVIKISKYASIIITDKGYLKIQENWRKTVAKSINCTFIQIEADIIIPVKIASDKEEYMARTIRPKINKFLIDYLSPIKPRKLNNKSVYVKLKLDNIIQVENPDEIMKKLNIDHSVKKVDWIKGGTSQAKDYLKSFINNKLSKYDKFRNEPSLTYQSNMSPYLHFGQISSIYIAIKVMEKDNSTGKDAYLEELIVRRELSINFVYYNKTYDNIECLPDWARNTLFNHKSDERSIIYSLSDIEKANTHDEYWNTAQMEMVKTGKMHGYMRMYWGKKILEWSESPEKAFSYAIYLNNKYSIDGRDPNGYAGIAWCFGKHDQAWKERPIFGKVRYMNYNGLKRKFNMKQYISNIKSI
jgi:deoxyribodipyrimidine photo-lyase